MQPLCAIGPARRKTLLCDRRPDSVVHNQITMALLWNPESWSQRLAELEAQSGDLKEAPLRRDVRSLGTLLGRRSCVNRQATELFAQVEALQAGHHPAPRRRREGPKPMKPRDRTPPR